MQAMLLPSVEDDGGTDSLVLQYVAVLSSYRGQSEAEGRYDEAQRAHRKLQAIMQDEEEVGWISIIWTSLEAARPIDRTHPFHSWHTSQRRREAVLARQAKETAALAAAHRQQLHGFEREWDAFLEDADAEARATIEQAQERHRQELAALHAERRREREELGAAAAAAAASTATAIATPAAALRVRWSPELLALRRKEELLRRQRAYGEASKVRRQAERLEARERAGARRERNAVWERREEKLRAQQVVELRVLRERAAVKRQGFLRQREADCRRLRQRNRNLRALLEERHQQQRARAASAVQRALEAAVHRGEEEVGSPGAADSTAVGDCGARAASLVGEAGAAATPAPARAPQLPSTAAGQSGKRSLFPRVEERGTGDEPPGG